MRSASALIACVAACAAERPTPQTDPTEPGTAGARAPALAEPAPDARALPSTPPPDAEAPPPSVRFPPADFAPPHERSAEAGDGKWVRLGDARAGDRAADGAALIYRTTVHPHPISKWITVTVAAIDLSRAAVHLAAGTDDPQSKTAPAELRTGLVAPEHADSVLAIMNGGWKTSHGRWGVMIGGHVFVEPRVEGCTIAIRKDGSVAIAPWPEIEGQLSETESYRQTPPCLVSGGELHSDLLAGRERAWGGNTTKDKTRRRSALGVDGSGKILFYGFGDEAGARMLAEGMRLAGASAAAETDINYSWTRFLLVGQRAGSSDVQITSTLVPKMVHQKQGYLKRPAARDFFYVRRR